jgi:hypothetical protein
MNLNEQAALANNFFRIKNIDQAIAVYVGLVKLSEYKPLKNVLEYCFLSLLAVDHYVINQLCNQ